MESERSQISTDVSQLDATGRLWLEQALGRSLAENERVVIATRQVPDAQTCDRLWSEYRRIQREVAAYQATAEVSSSDIQTAIDESLNELRARRGDA